MNKIIQIFGIIFGFGILIFIHELGHFIVAKIYKVKILTFAFGFGPSLIEYNYKDTKYCVKIIPFGGFVSMAGENPNEFTGTEGEYLSLKWYKKILISFSGPLLNYLLAIILFIIIFNMKGIDVVSMNSSYIGSITKGSYMSKVGIKPGDKIKTIDDININTWYDLYFNIRNKVGKRIFILIDRKGTFFNLDIIIKKKSIVITDIMGAKPYITNLKYGFLKSVYLGIKTPIRQTMISIAYIIDEIISFRKPEISGPVGVIQIMSNAAKSGMYDYLKCIAIVSVALGLFNLFPIPMVDGGMIVLFFIEGIIKRCININVIKIYNTIGLIFILIIFFFATYIDILRLV
ncbi:MAG: M50 family metallopeptidase [Endomicrobium sp.]|jgi:regulator of sigma E protease|nr:M50 family metallopeptidase [Endomicrobium sp.]